MEYIPNMEWSVEFDSACSAWFENLEPALQNEIMANLKVLAKFGPSLGRPRVDGIKGSIYPNMKELRVQYKGDPWRLLFVFDPRRAAIVLVGGNKGGDARWYKGNIPIADGRYAQHLKRLEKENRERNSEEKQKKKDSK